LICIKIEVALSAMAEKSGLSDRMTSFQDQCGLGAETRPQTKTWEARCEESRVFAIPFDCLGQAVFKVYAGLETEEFFGLCGVETTAGLPIRFRWIPADFPFETRQLGDQIR
jgi:hypothetical protein